MTTPTAPTSVAVVMGNLTADVTWSAPSSNGGSAVQSYKVYCYVNGSGSASFTKTVPANVTTTTISGLTNSSSNVFRVSATNRYGESSLSTASTACVAFRNAMYPQRPVRADLSCNLWLDAAETTTVTLNASSNVTQWTDKSSVGNVALGYNGVSFTPAGQNGLNYIGLRGSNDAVLDYLLVPSPAGDFNHTKLTLFCLVFFPSGAVNNTANNRGIISLDTPGYFGYGIGLSATGNNGQYNLASNNAFTDTGVSKVTGQWNIISATYDTSAPNAKFSHNGTLTTVSSIGQGTPDNTGGFKIGIWNIHWPYNTVMDIAETCVFTRALSDTERQNMEGYLAWKWGIQTSLPASHRFSGTALPSAPATASVTRNSASQVTVNWTAPVSNGTSARTYYVIRGYIGTTRTIGPLYSSPTDTFREITTAANSLVAGTTYTFTVTAQNSSGEGPPTTTESVVPYSAPATPTGITATLGGAGNTQATVSWTAPASNGATITNYTVQRYLASNNTTDGSPVLVYDATSTTISGLSAGTGYYFKVSATNAAGTSAESSASTTVTPTSAPGAPTIGTATRGNGQATVSFTAPASNGGATITRYNVISSPPGGIDASGVSSPITVTGLTNGTAYTFTVTATNSVGTSSASAASNSVTPATTPGAPTIGTATRGASQATVTWSAPASNGGDALTKYTIQRYLSSNNATDGIAVDVSANVTSRTITGLTNGTSYYFKVTATNTVGTSAESSASSAVIPATTPDAPTIGTATRGDAQATVTWSAPASNGGDALTKYTVQAYNASTNGTVGSAVDVSANVTSRSITGLTNGTSYYFKVTATNTVGTSVESSASNSVTPATTPGAPTITGVTRGDSQVTVTWSAPASNGGDALTKYTIQRYLTSNGTADGSGVDVSANVTSRLITGLTNGTSYYFTVTATNTVGTGSPSANSSAVIPATTPGAPTIGTPTPGNGQVTVTWTAPVSTGGPSISAYSVQTYLASNNSTVGSPVSVSGDVTTRIMGSLTNGTSYYFKVRATNSAGLTSAESSASTAVYPYYAPGVPTITSVDVSGFTLTVNVTPSPIGESSITMYNLTVYDLANSGNNVNVNQLSTTFEAIVADYGDYEIDVQAANANASSDSSTRYPISILSAPTAPQNISRTLESDNVSVTVGWSAPASTGGRAISKYTVEVYDASDNSLLGSPIDVSATETDYLVAPLTPSMEYYFKVYAHNAVDVSLAGQSSNITIPYSPDPPTIVDLTPEDSQVIVTWTAPIVTGASPIASYSVQAYLTSSAYAPVGSPVSVSGDVTTATVTGLTNGTEYYFIVSVVNIAGLGSDTPASDPVTPRTVPNAPTLPSATPENGQVTVSWTASASNGGAAITSYTVNTYVHLISSPFKQTHTADGSSTTVNVTGLTNGTSYRFKVFATNEAGNSALSSEVSAIPRSKPSAPQSVSATAGKESVALSWSAPLLTGGAAIQYYTISDASSEFIADVSENVRTYTHTGRTANSTYFYVITASNVAGESSSSERVSATPYTNPGAPTITSVDPGNKQAILTWSAAAENSSPITNYRITSIPASEPKDVSGTSLTGTITGLTNGTSYTFTVTATNAADNGPDSSASDPAVVPNALPTGPFTVVDQDTGLGTAYSIGHVLTVSNGISDEDGFQSPFSYKWQIADASGGAFTDISGATTSTYTIVLADLNKYYRCVASYTDGIGRQETYTTTNVAGPVVKAVPYAPTGVTATEGHQRATVSWTAPTNNGGASITGYKIISTPSNITATIADPSAVSGDITGLTAGTSYTFTVRAVNEIGDGQLSSATSAVTPYTVPDAPTDVIATAGKNSATVTWTEPFNNSSTITEYAVKAYRAGVYVSTETNTLPTETVTFTNLDRNVGYTFVVTATNAAGEGASSSASDSITPYDNPDAPTLYDVTPGNKLATVSYTLGYDNSSAITHATLTARVVDSSEQVTSSFVPSGSGILYTDISGLRNGVPYEFYMTATNAAGDSSDSNVKSERVVNGNTFFLIMNAPPVDNVSIVLADTGASEMTYYVGQTLTTDISSNANALTDEDDISGAIEYQWKSFDGYDTRESALDISGATQSTYLIAPELAGSRITAYISYTDGVGKPQSVELQAYTSVIQPILPDAPASIDVSDTLGQFVVSWTPPVSDGGSEITGYTIYVENLTNSNYSFPLGASSADTSITITMNQGLRIGHEYSITVTATNSVGEGAATSAKTATFIQVPTPTITVIYPYYNTYSDVGEISFRWSTDDVPNSIFARYEIYDASADTLLLTHTGDVYGPTGSYSLAIQDVSGGVPYSIKMRTVIAYNGTEYTGDFSAASDTVTSVSKPSAPTAVTATAGNGQIAVTWTAPTYTGGRDINHYRIYYANADLSVDEDISANADASSVTITGLTNGELFTVTVKTVISYVENQYDEYDNFTGTTDVLVYSAEAFANNSAQIQVGTVPDAPTITSVTPGDGTIEVSFNAPGFDGGLAISGYTVTATDGITNYPASGSSSPITVTGLTNGTAYTCTVVATNLAGDSVPSTASDSVTPRTVPNAPSTPTVTRGNAQITVNWSQPAFNGGSTITEYTVNVYDASGEIARYNDISATSLTVPFTTDVSGLTNGVTYTAKVLATNVAGSSESTASDPVTPATTPDAPTSVSAVRGNTEATISFTPSASDGGDAITRYIVTSSPGGIDASGSSSPITVTGLTNGTAYTFTVRAINAVGTSSDSSASEPVTPATVPDAPTSVLAVRGNTEATISFTASASDGGEAITRYIITSSPGGIDASGSSSPITVTGLTNGTGYTFTVRAINAVGMSSPSSASSTVTPATTPDAPTSVSAVRGNAQATVSFTAPASNGATITRYIVTSSPGGIDASGASSPITVTGLTNGTAYTFTVRATNAVGTGSASSPSSAVTPVSVPGAPTDVSGTPGDQTIAVSWTAPADKGGGTISGYKVYTYNAGNSLVSTLDASSTSVTVTGLTNGASYTVRVSAVTENGEGATSSASSAVIPRTVPGAPTGVSCGESNQQINVAWSAPASNGGNAIIKYTVYTHDASGNQLKATDASATPTSKMITDLTNGVFYKFSVSATNAAGEGAKSTLSAPAKPRTVPDAPTDVSGVHGNGQVTISFTPPANNGGDEIYIYAVNAMPGNFNVSGVSSPIVVTGMTNGTAYTFKMRAINNAGGSVYTNDIYVTPRTTPSAPLITGTIAGDGNVEVSFNAGFNGGALVSSYTVTATTDTSGTLTASGSTSPITVNGLTNGLIYTLKVKATNSEGTGADSSGQTAIPTKPVVALDSGVISKEEESVFAVGTTVITAMRIDPVPDAVTGLSTVEFIPDDPLKPTVQVQNVPEAVADVTIGVSAPNEQGVAYIKIIALDAEGQKVSNFTTVPLKVRVTLPGFTSAMVTLQTSDTLGGQITDTITAYRIGLTDTYEFTTTHLTYFSASQYVPCFVAGTRILTAEGYKAVETLTADDLIRTADNRIVPFRMFTTRITATSPETAPYTIPANTFGRSCPASNMTISPYHAILSGPNTWQIPKYASQMFRGITQAEPGQPITYYHLELPNYFKDNIVAEGTVVESYGNRQTAGMKTVYRLNEGRTGFTRMTKPKSASKTA